MKIVNQWVQIKLPYVLQPNTLWSMISYSPTKKMLYVYWFYYLNKLYDFDTLKVNYIKKMKEEKKSTHNTNLLYE